MRRVALITGASGGIGADLARVFSAHGHDLALVARSRDRLDALADEIAALGRPRPLVFAADLAERGAVEHLAAALQKAGASADILVNNAGFGLMGECAALDPAEQLAIVDLNVRALVETTLRFLPQIVAARGKILNVASIVSFFPGGPGMALYYASKAFVRSFTLALGQEMRGRGVAVTVLCPGYTRTGFQSRAGFEAETLAFLPGQSAMEVAEAGFAGLIAGRREVVPGLVNKVTAWLLPFSPKALILPVLSRLQQKRRGNA
jgi:hypothetical protein